MAAASLNPSIIPAICYENPEAALDWLAKAFGFEISMMIEDEQGKLVHSQMSYGDGLIMVGSVWSADHASPQQVGRRCTQTVHIHTTEDIDAHCDHARSAGAEIVQEPDTQFYGDRTYRARDPEGHIWTFGQTVREMATEEWEKASGLKARFA